MHRNFRLSWKALRPGRPEELGHGIDLSKRLQKAVLRYLGVHVRVKFHSQAGKECTLISLRRKRIRGGALSVLPNPVCSAYALEQGIDQPTCAIFHDIL